MPDAVEWLRRLGSLSGGIRGVWGIRGWAGQMLWRTRMDVCCFSLIFCWFLFLQLVSLFRRPSFGPPRFFCFQLICTFRGGGHHVHYSSRSLGQYIHPTRPPTRPSRRPQHRASSHRSTSESTPCPAVPAFRHPRPQPYSWNSDGEVVGSTSVVARSPGTRWCRLVLRYVYSATSCE